MFNFRAKTCRFDDLIVKQEDGSVLLPVITFDLPPRFTPQAVNKIDNWIDGEFEVTK